LQDAQDHLAGLRVDQAVFLAGVNDRLDFFFQVRCILGRKNPLDP
jgi:hypothetical protein